MALKVVCASCKQKLTFPDQFAGREVQCPGCMSDVKIPGNAGVSDTPVEYPTAHSPEVPTNAASPQFLLQPTSESGIDKPSSAAPKPSGIPHAAPVHIRKRPSALKSPRAKPTPVDDDDLVAAFETEDSSQPSSRGKALLIAVLCLFLVAGIGVGAYFYIQNANDGNKGETYVDKGKLDKTEGDKKAAPLVASTVPAKDPAPLDRPGEIDAVDRIDLKQVIIRAQGDRERKYVYALVDDSSIQKIGLADKTVVEVVSPHPRRKVENGDFALAPDGKTVARGLKDHGIDLIDLFSKEITPLWNDKVDFRRMAFSPDGKKLYVQLAETLACFDLETKKKLYEFRSPDGFIQAWAISPDGSVIAAGADRNDFYLVNAADGKLMHKSTAAEKEGASYVAGSFAFSPDGKKAASGWSKHVHIWHAPSQKQRPPIDVGAGLRYAVNPGAVAFFNDGNRLAVATNRGRVFLFDVLTGQRRAVLKTAGDHASAGIVLSGDEKRLALAHDRAIVLWNLDAVPLDPIDTLFASVPDPVDIVRFDSSPMGPGSKDGMAGMPTTFDQFGNPRGNFGLGQDGEFKGRKILVWASFGGDTGYVLAEDSPLWTALRGMGFEVTMKSGVGAAFPQELLKDSDQLWVFSSDGKGGPDPDLVADFVRAGKGLYLLADNDPYHYDANAIGKRLFGAAVSGNYNAQRIAYVDERRMDEDMIRKFGGQFPITDHPLFTGVNFMYEGHSVSTFNETANLKTIMYASDAKPLIGVSYLAGTRVVVDCGFTRYYYSPADPMGPRSFITHSAGTVRFGQNVAAFLAGKGRVESFARIDPLRKDPFAPKPPLPGPKPGLMGKDPLKPPLDPFKLRPMARPFGDGDKASLAGKIEPFLGGWIDTEANSALFTQPKGLLKVFSYPDFKLRFAWKLPGVAQRAVFDKERGLMYALVPNYKNKDPFAKRGASQVMVFDFREVMDGKIKPAVGKDQLTPARTLNLPGFCTHMSLSPDGDWLYFLENKDLKSARALRVSAETGEAAGMVPLHEFSDGLVLTSDGRALYAISHNLNRTTAKPGTVTGKLQVIDPADMTLRDSFDVPIDPNDIDATTDGIVFLTGYGPAKTDILIVDANNKDRPVLATWRGVPAACCLKLDEAGGRLIVRNTKGTPTSAASLPLPADFAGSDLPRVSWGLGQPTTSRGEFFITPDGRFLFCESGQVYQLGVGDPGGFGGFGGLGGIPAP